MLFHLNPKLNPHYNSIHTMFCHEKVKQGKLKIKKREDHIFRRDNLITRACKPYFVYGNDVPESAKSSTIRYLAIYNLQSDVLSLKMAPPVLNISYLSSALCSPLRVFLNTSHRQA